MDPNFKPYESGLLTIEERYPCGKSIGQRGRANVYYLCKCKCGKEFIVTVDELLDFIRIQFDIKNLSDAFFIDA